MRIRVPSRRVRERFLLIYEIKGCQKAVDFLTEYYGIKRMKIVLDGRKVGNGNLACYDKRVAYFTRRGLNKSTILHELYHHVVESKGLELLGRIEEKEANDYSKNFPCYEKLIRKS